MKTYFEDVPGVKEKKEFVQLIQPSEMEGIELFSPHLFKHSFSKHMHEAYTIGIHDRGTGSFLYRGEQRRTHPGCLVILNPGEVHTIVNEKKGKMRRDLQLKPSGSIFEFFSLKTSSDTSQVETRCLFYIK